MRIMISGGAGFIGSHLWDALEADGNHVDGFDNFLTGCNMPERVAMLDIAARRNSWIPNEDWDLLVHCAASYADPNAWRRDAETNVVGMLNAIDACRERGAKLVYFQTALPARSSYAISKLAAGQYLDLATDVPSVTFRLANIYGPRNLSGPVPAFYKRLVAGQECVVAETYRDFVYIDDLVAFVLAHLDGEGTLDVHTGRQTAIHGVYAAVRDTLFLTGERRLVASSADDVSQMDFAGPPLTPTVSLEDGVARACEWYAEHGVADTYTHLALR